MSKNLACMHGDMSTYCYSCWTALQSCQDTDLSGTSSTRMSPWVDATLAGFNNGLRRKDNEAVVVIAKMTTQGVCSSAKTLFTVNETTRLLHSAPKNSVAIIVLPNRAADLRSRVLAFMHTLHSCFHKI